MSTVQLTRAWSDPTYRETLSEAELEGLSHPSGDLNEELAQLLVSEAAPFEFSSGSFTCTCTCTATQYSSRPCCC